MGSGNSMVDAEDAEQDREARYLKHHHEPYSCEHCPTDDPERHICKWCTEETDEQECQEHKGQCAACAMMCHACFQWVEECQCPGRKANI